MQPFHTELLSLLVSHSHASSRSTHSDNYHGTTHLRYNIRTPIFRAFVKQWVSEHKNIPLASFTRLLESLNAGKSHEEKILVGFLLVYYPKLRKRLDPTFIEQLLDGREGWSEVDNLCQSVFSAQEMLEKWKQWGRVLRQLVVSREVIKRRASLVLLTGPVGESDDRRLADIAFESIGQLQHEKDILITKAISWLLRDLIKNHRKRVEEYLLKNKATLPAIAVRETMNKLKTGKK